LGSGFWKKKDELRHFQIKKIFLKPNQNKTSRKRRKSNKQLEQ